MLKASHKSWIESDKMDMLHVNIQPKNSKIENEIFRINAIKIFFSVFISYVRMGNKYRFI